MATKTLHSLAGFMLTLLMVACTPIIAPPGATIPGVTIEVTADGLQVPAAIPAGLAAITYKNSTDAPTYPRVGWLKEGRTVAEFEQALLADDLPALMEMTIAPGAVDLALGRRRGTKTVTPETVVRTLKREYS